MEMARESITSASMDLIDLEDESINAEVMAPLWLVEFFLVEIIIISLYIFTKHTCIMYIKLMIYNHKLIHHNIHKKLIMWHEY